MNSKPGKKLWGGRFAKPASSILEKIGESISFDSRLYAQDIRGSIVHAKNLFKIGILNREELDSILDGLQKVKEELENNQLTFKPELEDIHMHIEARLTELIGDTGKKLHTGRSRNDQIALDVRLFIRDEINEILQLLTNLLGAFYKRAEESIDMVMPGYTHLQVAQPIRVSHYLMSYFWAFLRDRKQFEYTLEVNDELVLGSGALAGVNYPTDREFISQELGFSKISENSIDSVSQRDNVLNFLYACSQLMIHASKICEEIIIFSSQEFRFIRLPDSLSTGSSIMPQKKNPDIAELIRGKTGRVIANLNNLMILLKGIPLAYNRDLQEDKISLFDSVDQVKMSLQGLTAMIQEIEFLPQNMQNSLEIGFATATDLADYLVNVIKIPFREAHELVGKLVAVCSTKEKTLYNIDVEDRKSISEYFVGDRYFEAISLVKSTDKKLSYGSTSKKRQIEQLKKAYGILADLPK